MQSGQLLLGLIPLLVFVIVDSFTGPKTAILCGIIFALAEVVLSYFYFGYLDEVSFFACGLIVVMGGLGYFRNSALIFKLQPTLLGIFLFSYLMVTQYLGSPLILTMTEKYKELLPEQMQQMLLYPWFRAYLTNLNKTTAWMILMHALLVGWGAIRLNKWWWIFLRGIGFYIFLFFAVLWAQQITTIPL